MLVACDVDVVAAEELRQKRLAVKRAWYRKNRQKVSDYNRQYASTEAAKVRRRAKQRPATPRAPRVPPEVQRERRLRTKRAYRIRHADRLRETNKRWKALRRATETPAQRDQRRQREFKSRTGITLAQYAERFERQHGVCYICEQPERTQRRDGTTQRFAVDHNHTTGVVRGLLCSLCNIGLGCYGDDPERLRAAADYLEKDHEEC
jgi:hypothetical protein